MKIAIIGIGLIGGSLARALRVSGHGDFLIGIDSNAAHRQEAMALDLVDEVDEDLQRIREAELVILATPVDVILGLIPQVLDLIDDHQVVMDVGSTKGRIMQVAQGHEKGHRFVGTHPMAGTEYSGPSAAQVQLFAGKCTVIVDKDKSDPDAVQMVERLFEAIGMSIVYHASQEHDVHTAYVSHISHISSFALALTVLEKEENEKRIFELAGGGFESTVRLAKSNPDTWIPIFAQNRDAVLDVLDEHINSISKFRTLLIKKDFESFRDLIIKANQIRRILN
ncbi:MAG: prephenate dehydrogenase [Saprospiraceae bacterium]|nr:prephenate dehydrogenase [Saprospiraceae bacterium]